MDTDLDPHAPRLGTRAYRERERREMAEERKMRTIIVPADMAGEIGTGLDGRAEGMEGVVVVRTLERRVEGGGVGVGSAI